VDKSQKMCVSGGNLPSLFPRPKHVNAINRHENPLLGQGGGYNSDVNVEVADRAERLKGTASFTLTFRKNKMVAEARG